VRLAGTLTVPPGEGPFPAVFLASGSGRQDRDYGNYPWNHRTFLVLADQLTRAGVAVLRLDDRGIGGSGGSTATATNDDIVADALAAVAYLRGRPEIDAARVGIVGHSWGSLVAALAAARSESVRFIVSLGGVIGVPWADAMAAQRAAVVASNGASPEYQALTRSYFLRLQQAALSDPDSAVAVQRIHQVMQESRAEFAALLPDQPQPPDSVWQRILVLQARALVNRWYLEQLRTDPADYLPRIRVPVLLLAGTLDTTAPAEVLHASAEALRSADNDRVAAELLPNMNHFLQTVQPGQADDVAAIEETVAPVIAQRIIAWLKTVLPEH
jgi:uncharacterized protein